MQISLPRYGSLALTPFSSNNIPGPLLPGSTTLYCEQDFGTILIQEFNTDSFSIRYCIFNFFKKINLLFKEESTGIRSSLALKGKVNFKTGNNDKEQLKEGQFLVHKGESTDKKIFFDKDREYKFFDTTYSVELLNQLLASFPSIKNLFADNQLEGRVPEIKQHRFASAAMINIANEILKCPYDESLRKFYFENKVREFLFELLVQHTNTEPADGILSTAELSSLTKAKKIILNDLSQHFTIQQISRQVQLNEFKLKAGFKQQFGTGIFECLLQARMHAARDLLINTDKPIKEIASLTGYDFLTSFITAFRKYFGYTPGSIRRK